MVRRSILFVDVQDRFARPYSLQLESPVIERILTHLGLRPGATPGHPRARMRKLPDESPATQGREGSLCLARVDPSGRARITGDYPQLNLAFSPQRARRGSTCRRRPRKSASSHQAGRIRAGPVLDFRPPSERRRGLETLFANSTYQCLERCEIRSPTLPDGLDPPPERLQGLGFSLVTGAIACDLLVPKVGVRLGARRAMAAAVSVPEASVHEHHGPVSRQDDVGRARQLADMNPKSQSG